MRVYFDIPVSGLHIILYTVLVYPVISQHTYVYDNTSSFNNREGYRLEISPLQLTFTGKSWNYYSVQSWQ